MNKRSHPMDVAAFFFSGFFLAHIEPEKLLKAFFFLGRCFFLEDPVNAVIDIATVAILAQGKPSG